MRAPSADELCDQIDPLTVGDCGFIAASVQVGPRRCGSSREAAEGDVVAARLPFCESWTLTGTGVDPITVDAGGETDWQTPRTPGATPTG